mgnify:CR=1 FL=1
MTFLGHESDMVTSATREGGAVGRVPLEYSVSSIRQEFCCSIVSRVRWVP